MPIKQKAIVAYKERDRSLAQLKTDERVKLVLDKINKGVPNLEIINECAELWGIKKQSCYHYINLAVEEIATFQNPDRTALVNEYVMKYTNLYRIAMQKNQLQTAKAILDSMVKLLGIAAPTLIDARIDTTQRIIQINITPSLPPDATTNNNG
jgi:hypothetical protein